MKNSSASILLGIVAVLISAPDTFCLGDQQFDLSGFDAEEAGCMEATGNLLLNSPTLLDASVEYSMSMQVPEPEPNFESPSLTIAYPQDSVDHLQSECVATGGRLMFTEKAIFDCVSSAGASQMILINAANCIAQTEQCVNFDQIHMMEDVWSNMGMECTPTADYQVLNQQKSSGKKRGTDQQKSGWHAFGFVILTAVTAALAGAIVVYQRRIVKNGIEHDSQINDLGLDQFRDDVAPDSPVLT